MTKEEFQKDAVCLLKKLIATPSVSRQEAEAVDIMQRQMESYGLTPRREANNVWALDPGFTASRPTLLLNAHIDTVKPVDSWQRPPFTPSIEGDRLYGLGSNDCGGGLVTLLQVFRTLLPLERNYNLVYLASAEEEVSGTDGIRRALPLLPKIDAAIVGEPTGMQPAIAEKGLMVLDITARGRSGHAARNEGRNAIYEALDDLNWMRGYRFERVSPLLGPTLMNVTMISAGTQHNVIPDECRMVADIRTNEYYDNQEVFEFIRRHLKSEVKARSFHLRSSHIPESHPLVRRCVEMGLKPFGSPTLSDQALMPFPSLKLGPGESARSHSADEFICLSEINHAFDIYMQLLGCKELAF
ncbi:M20 family metallo-hydrolase [Prevotella sp. KH2C16]|uniref:M20 family metallo-hydrolase n=1 Tax=Prevotella sp. KH2C16 TaxID=1855325 RepID=UPI0008E11C8F|nr:M20 family metallo-hydrolase [Prevotella sp. KH2C16]SFG05149.1 acetylornithine deacetylase [Prevotella sp. KH2C16]